MANTNFTVHNGLTVGPTSIDATSGNISTTATFVTTNATNSTSTITGAMVISGGLGVGGSVNANAYYSNYYLYSNGAPITTPAGGSNTFVQFNDGTNFAGATYLQYNKASGNLVSNSTTASTSTTTGALVLSGGAGIGGSVYIGGSLSVGGNTTFINTTVITTTDTIAAPTINAGTIGNSGATLYGTLNSSSASQTNITSVGTLSGLTVSSAIVPSSNASINIGGTGSQYFNNIYAVNFLGTSTTAKYADLAERYTSDADYESGTVVDFGGTAEVTLSNINGSQYVAGVVSTNPAYLMNGGLEEGYVVVALTGRVPTKITGPIEKGAMMVSNGDGTARMDRNPKIGSVIGKALQSFGDGVGVIEVVVGRL
jgi:hypothetical protein